MKMLRCATLTVADPVETAERYRSCFDYQLADDGVVDAALAAAWGAPGMAGRRIMTLRPASGAEIFLRFVEGAPTAGYRPLRTFGWAAVELCVQDTLAVNARMERSPFEIIGPPQELDGLPAIFPMQVQGPDQEIVFLTQIREDLPEYDLPRAQSLVDHLFIIVLACSDMAASEHWFEASLGITAGRDIVLAYSVLSKAFDLPLDTQHRIATGVSGRDCFLEFDQYPDAATARPCRPGELPPGVALASFLHSDIDAIQAAWITPPAVRPGPLYAGRRSGALRAPDGTLVEVIAAD